MPSKVDKTPEQKLQERQMTKMADIVTKIQSTAPTMIKLSNGKECEIESDLIIRMYTGAKYSTTDWTKLSHLYLSVRAPRAVVSVGPAATLPALKDGETGFWIREVYTEPNRLQWCVTVCKPSSKVVTTYAVGFVTCERSDLSAIASTIGTLPHMLSTVFHQETADKGTHHVHFQDALLFDMLIEAEAAAAAQPSKRRRPLRERLAQQNVKEEP
ncbi:hypothetical protein BU25DRAFT_418883 [Macroventuria anomochaeta]|uniref:Uncharacterized protein n=1 Tax=Macroventuria anomochaeta TaxID=301207 RepID=A0ACB6SDF2_9PLEO|nr:uncharacterized protein BU25DRAFT_418883 [Macroventuria anomochaeta]KAF2631284.1 hypothetical protein BU25DRAFT_418883 [Macroventuria anomochaeta]